MQKTRLFSAGLISVIVLTFGFLWMTLSDSSFAAFSTTNRLDAAPDIAAVPYNSSLIQTPSADLGSDELPTTNLTTGIDSASALPTPIPGETQVYFVPSDNDASATVLFLYNTDTVTHTVALRGFSYNGVLVYSLNINILPTSFLRLASDSVILEPFGRIASPS